MPAWLVGGLIGVFYYLFLLGIDYYTTGSAGPGGGLIFVFYDWPATMVVARIPYIFAAPRVVQIVAFIVTNFVIGSLLGWWIGYFFQRKQR